MKKVILLGAMMAGTLLSFAQTTPWVTTGNTASSGDFLGTDGPAPLIFKTDNSERMQIDADGNVGIGTTPTAKLTVNSGIVTLPPGFWDGCWSPEDVGIFSSINSPNNENRAVVGYIDANNAGNWAGTFISNGDHTADNCDNFANNIGVAGGALGSGDNTYQQINIGVAGITEGNFVRNYGGFFYGASGCDNSISIGIHAAATGGNERYGIIASVHPYEGGGPDCEISEIIEGGTPYVADFAALFRGNTMTIGTAYELSDERFKANKEKISNASELLKKISTYTYNYNSAAKKQGASSYLQRGIMAQEIAEVLPNAVVRIKTPSIPAYKSGEPIPSEDIYAVNYREFIPLLISAVNEKTTENEELKEKMSEQEAKMEELYKVVNELKQQVNQICEKGCNNNSSSKSSSQLGSENLKFFPNPAQNRVTLELSNLDESNDYFITIYSVNGQTVFSQRVSNKNFLNEQIETKSWGAGAYTVSLSDKSKIVGTGSLIITK